MHDCFKRLVFWVYYVIKEHVKGERPDCGLEAEFEEVIKYRFKRNLGDNRKKNIRLTIV